MPGIKFSLPNVIDVNENIRFKKWIELPGSAANNFKCVNSCWSILSCRATGNLRRLIAYAVVNVDFRRVMSEHDSWIEFLNNIFNLIHNRAQGHGIKLGAITSPENVIGDAKMFQCLDSTNCSLYHRNISNIIGVVTITTWDMMDAKILEKPLESLVKRALYVSPRQTIDQLLPLLRKRDDHMAVVVDEFGSSIGMITMEDIIEEVVGEIDVGYDFDEYTPKKRHRLEEVEKDVYVMDARVPISEANEVLGASFSDREAHTMGGLITARLRRIPRVNDSAEEGGFSILVEQATARSATQLRLTLLQ